MLHQILVFRRLIPPLGIVFIVKTNHDCARVWPPPLKDRWGVVNHDHLTRMTGEDCVSPVEVTLVLLTIMDFDLRNEIGTYVDSYAAAKRCLD